VLCRFYPYDSVDLKCPPSAYVLKALSPGCGATGSRGKLYKVRASEHHVGHWGHVLEGDVELQSLPLSLLPMPLV
jgi:hypothetical protein